MVAKVVGSEVVTRCQEVESDSKEMVCINPIFVRRSGIHVRCGKCEPCLESRQKEWAVRLSVELRQCITAYFVTLTYNEYALELLKDLDKDCFQRFLKRLRQYVDRGMPEAYKGKKVSKINGKEAEIKYFAVGEYGSLKERPHWHIVLFNFPFNLEDSENIISFAWQENGQNLGFDKMGILSVGGIHYTTDYMFKNAGKDAIRLISKGLGAGYVTDNTVYFHQKTLDGLITVNHQKTSMPRYYAKKVYNEKQRKEIGEKKRDFIFDEDLNDPYKTERDYKALKQKIEYKRKKRKL